MGLGQRINIPKHHSSRHRSWSSFEPLLKAWCQLQPVAWHGAMRVVLLIFSSSPVRHVQNSGLLHHPHGTKPSKRLYLAPCLQRWFKRLPRAMARTVVLWNGDPFAHFFFFGLAFAILGVHGCPPPSNKGAFVCGL